MVQFVAQVPEKCIMLFGMLHKLRRIQQSVPYDHQYVAQTNKDTTKSITQIHDGFFVFVFFSSGKGW